MVTTMLPVQVCDGVLDAGVSPGAGLPQLLEGGGHAVPRSHAAAGELPLVIQLVVMTQLVVVMAQLVVVMAQLVVVMVNQLVMVMAQLVCAVLQLLQLVPLGDHALVPVPGPAPATIKHCAHSI